MAQYRTSTRTTGESGRALPFAVAAAEIASMRASFRSWLFSSALMRLGRRNSMIRVARAVAVAATLVSGASPWGQPLAAQALSETDFPKPTAVLKESFRAVRAVHALPDGRVLVMDGGAQKLLVADFASGKVDMRLNAGAEDGEFRTLGPLWGWPGDSVATLDAGKGRLMILGPDGALARAVPFGGSRSAPAGAPSGAPSGPPSGPPMGMPSGMPGGGMGAGGRGSRIPTLRALIGTELAIGTGVPPRPTAPLSPASAPPRQPYPIVRLSLRTLRYDTVAQLMPAQAPRAPATNTVGTFTVHVSSAPLQSVDVWAAYGDGTVAVVRAATYRIEWFALDGTTTSTDPVPFTPVAVTEGDRKRVVEAYRQVGDEMLKSLPTRTSILAVAYEDPPSWPTTHPPFRSDITPLVDRQERLWLATRCWRDEQALCYDVIDRHGQRVARYRLPPKSRLVAFGPDVAYTIDEQKSDKDVLQRHPLSRLP